MSETDVAKLYGSCDFIVHPYRGEGFGMHIQEAMACGCVPIVTAGGPTDEFAIGHKIASSNRVVNPYDIFALKVGDSMSNMGQHRWVLEPDAQSVALSILKSLVLDNQVAEYQALHQRVMKSVDAGEDIFDLFDKMLEVRDRLYTEIGNRQRAISQNQTMSGVATRKAGV
jgi:glycosyltransferase involved in cell wall biosynthesis